ncbi:MAG TPA: DUF2855 domain-containing protein [Porticoccaceae bacterium]|jgi:hypothetical protein|nr:DUF2855 domain-containing protein [Porticoccaceae bacterium]
MSEFQTFKKDLTKSRIVETDEHQAIEALQDGEVLVRIERFAFTANNVTYGAAGDTIGYWKFFPASADVDEEWGCLPVWGFAEIRISKVDELLVGERIYGYFPPADFLVLSPKKISLPRFVDGAAHRAELPAVYNNYIRMSAEENCDSDTDNLRSLLNPLHITSFCLCDSLEDSAYEGASQIVVLSASSKTAIGLAQGLADLVDSPLVVGITSSKNYDFVASLGCYENTICYDELSSLDTSKPTVMVDMAGNRAVLGELHEALGEKLLSCVSVGMTHWETLDDKDPLAAKINRARSHFFFAPAHIQKRIGDWGQDGFNQRTSAFMAARIAQSADWMSVTSITGFDAFSDTYKEIVVGKMNPNEGLIICP